MPDERERMLAGEPYDPTDPELTADRRRARELVATYNGTLPGATDRRETLLRELFGTVGRSPTVEPPLRVDYGDNVHVGDDFFANYGLTVLDVVRVEFGDGCLLGPNVDVYTATHPIEADERASGLESGEPVTVGDDVWVGGRAVLNPGMTIGDRAVVAAGAVVTRDVPAGTVVGGNPAEILRELD
jgi:maltose O-acetyltransferase